jgi:hypothetical protein
VFQWSREEIRLGWLLALTTASGALAVALSDFVTVVSLFVPHAGGLDRRRGTRAHRRRRPAVGRARASRRQQGPASTARGNRRDGVVKAYLMAGLIGSGLPN